MRKLAIDWSHKKDKFKIYDGDKFLDQVPLIDNSLVIFTENFPDDRIEEWKSKGADIYGCGTHWVKEKRKELEWDKSDKNDAKIIWLLSEEHPEIGDIFYELHETPTVLAKWRIMQDAKEQRKKAKQREQAYNYMDLSDNVRELDNMTNRLATKVRHELEEFDIWNEWLADISGVGETVAGGLLGQIYKKRINQFADVASLWHYCGLHVVNGKAPSPSTGQRLDYNPKLKMILLQFLGEGFVKQRTDGYRDLYDREKEYQLNREFAPGHLAEKYDGYSDDDTHLTKGHAHNRARRKAVKEFLKHLWYIWREMEGISTEAKYNNKFLIEPPECPVELENVEVVDR